MTGSRHLANPDGKLNNHHFPGPMMFLLVGLLSFPAGFSQAATNLDTGTFGSLPPGKVFNLMQGDVMLTGTFETDSQGRLAVQLPEGEVTTLIVDASTFPLPTETPVGGTPLGTDLDGDHMVMNSDLLLFIEAWHKTDQKIDLNGDTNVNSEDLYLFQNDWFRESGWGTVTQ